MAGSTILDSRGNPITAFDSVSSAIQQAAPAQGMFARQPDFMSRMFAPQIATAAYLASGMLQKVIDIPASDRVREWRDWQAEKEQIEAIEAEEKRLGLIAKVRHAELLRGLGGGALIIITNDGVNGYERPLTPEMVQAGDIVAINVVSRSQITGEDYDTNLASPTYGAPKLWRMNDASATATRLHPSRVICFRGDPQPPATVASAEDAFWGRSRLMRVWQEVQRSDSAQDWFAALVRKAKLLRIGIPNLTDYTATDNGQARLDRRMSAVALGESILNATVFDTGDGTRPAETITDYQVTWAGIPAMMDAFDQRVAAVADIPFTRLMGRSPAGMNATGTYDDQNWAKAVSAGQQLEVRPCLEALDPILLRSAGVAPEGIWWKWAPLWAPTEKETADTFKIEMEAITALQATGSIPEVAFNKGVQNLMSEREYLPGLDQALSEIPEDERFGLTAEPDGTDPSAIAEGGDPVSQATAGGDGSAPARRAANDKVPEAGE